MSPTRARSLGGEVYELNTRERGLLDAVSFEPAGRFSLPGELKIGPGKAGPKTFAKLVELGLIEKGIGDRHNEGVGYRLTDDGSRCMYGKTNAEILADGKRGIKTYPRKIWSWPLLEESRANE